MSIGTGPGVRAPNPAPAKPPPAGKKWKLALAGLIGIYILLAAYGLITNADGIKGTSSATTASTGTPSPKDGTALSPGSPAASGNATASAPSYLKPTSSPGGSRAGSPTVHSLGVSSITAVGPDGPSDGDNPRITFRLLTLGADQPWYSQWYTTPSFGGLRSGTGLLLDLGKAETVTDVRLTLGSEPGADIEVRVGSTPSVDLPTIATAYGAAGSVRLKATTSTEGRYVLIWFTRLPPDGHGHYQIDVYNVEVDGVSG